MNRQRGKRKASVRRIGATVLTAAMLVETFGNAGLTTVSAAQQITTWKSDVTKALDDVAKAMANADSYAKAKADLKNAYDGLEKAKIVENLKVASVTEDSITLEWDAFEADNLVGYNVYWADKNLDTTEFLLIGSDGKTVANDKVDGAMTLEAGTESKVTFTVNKSTFRNLYFKVAPVTSGGAGAKSEVVKSPTAVEYHAYLEDIDRGMTATLTDAGVYLNWRLLASEVKGYSETGLTGMNFNVYRDGTKIATVTDSTNYLDTAKKDGLASNTYKLVPVDADGTEQIAKACEKYTIFTKDADNKDVAYVDIPLKKPADTTIADTYGITTITSVNSRTDNYGTNPDASAYTITYTASDASIGDVDGDGEYEYFVKWDPSLSKDVSQVGYTGKTYIDCYELDGTLLWRLDLGVNIRSGAHYTEYAVYDYDKDGKAELMVKTAPGSKMITYNADGTVKSEKYVTNTESAVAEGATDTSSYVFSAADYRQYLIEYFQHWGVWDNYDPEIVASVIECEGGWSNNLVDMFTVDTRWRDCKFYIGEGNTSKSLADMTTADIQEYIPEYQEGDKLVNVTVRDENGAVQYPADGAVVANLKTVRVQDVKNYYGGYDLASVDFDATDVGYTEEQATILADYFLKHYQYRMKKHNLETYEGYIITGPEYISLFDCSDGTELDTQDWYFDRVDDGMLWCDYALDYIEPGNRVDRFNATVAYLDGETPSCIMGRGYYSRTTMAAYNVVDKKLQLAGAIDSGFSVMKNPFNDSHGADGVDPVTGPLAGQGDHYIAVADVDGDGRQDIINGGAIVSYDMDKKDLYLYSSGHATNTDTGAENLKYGHGDAIHITDIDPDRPGLEIVSCFEGGQWAPYNWALRDTETNTAIFGVPGSTDYGRIIIGDVLTNVRGLELDTGKDCKGNTVALTGVSNNMNIKWSADMSTQFVTGARTSDVSVIGNVGGKNTTFMTAKGYRTNNDTKGNPNLVADMFGDYREEIMLRKDDSSSVRIYMNIAVSDHKNYTLMQNTQYRVGIASQNSAYNQPAYTDYYYASDADWEYVWLPNQTKDQEPGEVASVAEVAKADANVIISEDVAAEEDHVAQAMEGYKFDFGTKNGTGEGFTSISVQEYSAEKGYGFTKNTDTSKIDAGNKGLKVNNAEEGVTTGLVTAAADFLYTTDASDVEFAIDVPAGTYRLDIVGSQGANTNASYNNNQIYINGVSVGNSCTANDGFASMAANTLSRKVTLVEDGQIVVTVKNTGRPFLNAIVLNEYVIEIPAYNNEKWDAYLSASEGLAKEVKNFADDSEPADYTVGLVTLMQATADTATKVRYMALVDTADGDALYAKAEDAVAHKATYTEATIATLEVAMKAYTEAAGNLTITTEIQALMDTLAFWLDGVTVDGDVVKVGEYDPTELQALIMSVGEGTSAGLTLGEGTLKEKEYSKSSWEALKEAYTTAYSMSTGEGKSIQTMKVVYNNLAEAYAGLSKAAPATQYAFDFGPAEDPTYGAPQIANANTLTESNHGFTLNGKPCTLVTGADLYADIEDDNRNHFGLKEETNAGVTTTNNPGAYFRDYLYGEGGKPYTFQADVEEGYWYVYVYTGDKAENHTVDFYFGDGAKAYGNNDAAILAGTRAALTPESTEISGGEGKTVYTQAYNGGGQYAAANAVYRVYVPATAADSNKGLFSITCFDHSATSETAVTARLNGLEMARMSYEKALEEAIKEAKAYDPEKYTTTSYAPIAAALKTAEALVGSADEKKAETVAAIEALDTAVTTTELVEVGDKTELNATIELADTYTEANFSADSWTTFQEALAAAKTVSGERNATKEMVSEALTALKAAMEGLENIVDVDALITAVEEAEAIDSDLYTPNSYADLMTVIAAAREKLNDKNISAADVEEQVAAITEATAALVARADRTALEAAIEKANAVDETLYTADSYAKVTEAVEAADALDGNATQAEVDAAAKAIEDAIKALVPVQTADSESTGESQTPGNSQTDESQTPGNSQTGESQTPGNSQTGESQAPGNSQTGESQAPGNSQTGESQATGNSETPGDSQAPAGPAKGKDLKKGTDKYKVTVQGKEVAYTGTTNKKATSITIPATVKIDDITYSVTSIGNNAFAKNTKLKKVTIGKNVATIGNSAFEKCTKLTTVKFAGGSKCKTIGTKAFNGAKALTTITLPNSVQKIGTSAFASCTALKSVTVGTGLKEIGAQAFNGDKKLSKITIKSTKLTKVGKNALKGTKKNVTIKVPKNKVNDYKKKFKAKGQNNYKVTKL